MQKGRKQTRYDYRVKLTDSQNFITNKKLVKRITRISNINKEDTVIEIGTGKGHLTEVPNPATDIWLVMEKGAAKRFTGAANKTEKSLLLKVNWEIEVVYYFRREDFHPMPSVDSVMVHFARKPFPDLNKSEYAAFKKFIVHSKKYGFGSKKGLLTKKQVNIALKQACLPQAHENGVTLYIQWLCLFRCYRHIYRNLL